METKKLIEWYQENKRTLPFRNTGNPYDILVSEVMLQQTQVKTVIPYFEAFKKAYPTLESLAKTDDFKLALVTSGLGYYRRFRNLRLAAIEIVEKYQGIIPNQYDQLIQLKGIGAYTAGAILSIGYHQPYAATDGNVLRVLSRYEGIFDSISLAKTKAHIHKINQKYIEKAEPDVYTQAMMELGALVCSKHAPKCEVCPLKHTCYAYRENQQKNLPVVDKKAVRPVYGYVVFVLMYHDHYIIHKREETLLHGSFAFYQVESESVEYALESLKDKGIDAVFEMNLGHFKHQFTHQIWNMQVVLARVLKMNNDGLMVSKDILETYPMARVYQKVRAYII